MAELTLQEYTSSNTLQSTADKLGVTKGGVWQMLRDKRDIRLKIDINGEILEAYEVKAVGQIKKVRAA